jgi:hypothetical protein
VQVKVVGNLNFEEKNTYTILTKLTSPDGADSKEFPINVKNINEKPEASSNTCNLSSVNRCFFLNS